MQSEASSKFTDTLRSSVVQRIATPTSASSIHLYHTACPLLLYATRFNRLGSNQLWLASMQQPNFHTLPLLAAYLARRTHQTVCGTLAWIEAHPKAIISLSFTSGSPASAAKFHRRPIATR